MHKPFRLLLQAARPIAESDKGCPNFKLRAGAAIATAAGMEVGHAG
jgi:hypothetical protein